MARVKTILVPFESWYYLKNKMRNERLGSDVPTDKKWLERKFNHTALYDGWGRLMDGDLGGAIGKPENSYEEGRWTSWSVEDMKRMLDEAGLPYKDTKDTEVIGIL